MVSRLLDPDHVDRKHCEVIGVTELYGRLYVLQNKSKSIHVSLADKPYSMLSDVPLDGVIELTDLAASTFDSCLYVCDVGNSGCIWRVQVDERVSESSLECVALKWDQNASELEGTASIRTDSAQRSDDGHDDRVKQLNSTGCSTVADAADEAESVAESLSVTIDGEKQPVSETQNGANKLPEALLRDRDQCKQVDFELQELMQLMNGCSGDGAVNVTNTPLCSKSELSSATEVATIKDENAGEMIRSLLERTGLMKKISERGNPAPCVFEVSRHYSVKRFLFTVDIRFCCLNCYVTKLNF